MDARFVIHLAAFLSFLLASASSMTPPTCSNPEANANTACPSGEQCWDASKVGATTSYAWSVHSECADCFFAQQPRLVVQTGETVRFTTDGTFRSARDIVVYKVPSMDALKNCDIAAAGTTLVGQTFGSTHVDVTQSLVAGANYFISHPNNSPNQCEEGARIVVYRGDFSCSGNCSSRGPCVFDGASDFVCRCPGGYLSDDCSDIDECFNVTACGDPVTEGVCVDGNCSYACNCLPFWTSVDGLSCNDVRILTDCSESPCQNGGTCNKLRSGIFCECLFGYDGTYCELNVDDCQSNPCQNGGTCVDGENAYTCTCVDDFTGVECETNMDECVAYAPCSNGGTCVDEIDAVTCTCSSPWIGDFCQIHSDDCLVADCQNGATCVDGNGTHSCACVVGFTGARCETDIDECASSPCENRGVCIDNVADYTCNCPTGYTGKNCEININECQSNPCANGGTCNDLTGRFHCECIFGFSGLRCETNDDECQSNPCQNGATCRDGINRYTCDCIPGYTGVDCETNVNECASMPCENGGACIDMINSFECQCPAGFTGLQCETNIDECSSSPCQNGASCNDEINRYSCSCLPGFTGVDCETNIDECASSPCQNGAACRDEINEYNCQCIAGYTGIHCETNIDDCDPTPCQNGGSCTDLVDDFSCDCVAGFTGTQCETDIDECGSNPCENGATCHDQTNGYACQCVTGFTGVHCETNIGECGSMPCQNGATCRDDINMYTCDCAAGFTGMHCETNIDECASSPCTNMGTCVDDVDSYWCRCVPGFTGMHCETNIDECASSPCQNGATCNDEINRYSCSCLAGFTNVHCETNIDECESFPCQNGGLCTDLINDYACNCSEGFDGKSCGNDIDECSSSPCQNSGVCMDGVAGYTCECPTGRTGSHCEIDIDECASKPCQNGGTCNNLQGRFYCECRFGFDGIFCEINIDDCASNPCQNNATCIDAVNDYTCQCVPGFTGDHCQTNINECESAPCQNDGTCSDHVNHYTCSCIDGFTGVDCETNIDECASSPCENRGVCMDRINFYTCHCLAGYTGEHCETDINECQSNPCANGGTCNNLVDRFHCECVFGFSGLRCETNDDECQSDPCQNGATCQDGIGRYTCDCVAGYTGVDCETNVNECASLPCQNSGTCVDLIDAFECQCPAGFTGIQCETNIDECASSPCSNKATCIDDIDFYLCRCAAGFTGVNCETNIDECAPAPCQNDATCTDLIADYLCTCHPGFSGVRCETNIDECASMPCQNGGICTDFINAFECHCPFGYTGTLCETDVDECASMPCQNGGTCVDDINGYGCRCVPGYIGVDCETELNECNSAPCQNSGTCVDMIGMYSCTCRPGFTDVNCETNINECASMPCQNGAVCFDEINGFHCRCVPGYTGRLCQREIVECLSRPCQNGGTCDDLIDDFTCHCAPGFTGPLCETNVDECASSPCLNGGTCRDGVNSYQCTCPSAFDGDHCEIVIDACGILMPCQNDGTCVNIPTTIGVVDVSAPPGPGIDIHDAYTCTCPSLFTDRLCATFMPVPAPPTLIPPPPVRSSPPPPTLLPPPPPGFSFDCSRTPCQNSGACQSIGGRANSFCSCPIGFSGRTCSNDISVSVPAFGGSGAISYIEATGSIGSDTSNTIAIRLKASGPSGLIFLSIGSQQPPAFVDYISFHVVDGFANVRYDLGAGSVSITSPNRIDTGETTVLEFRRNGVDGELWIDGVLVGGDSAPSGSTVANTDGPIYLGGIPAVVNVSPLNNFGPTTGFTGCIIAVSIDGNEVDLLNGTTGMNVGECPLNPCSDANPCQNGGACRPTDLTNFECVCPTGTSGDLCEVVDQCTFPTPPCLHGGACRIDSTSSVGYRCICSVLFTGPQCENPVGSSMGGYSYFGDSYASWMVDQSLRRTTNVALKVYPSSPASDATGILAYVDKPGRDFFAIFADRGTVKVVFDFGGGSLTVANPTPLADGVFTSVILERSALDVKLVVAGNATSETLSSLFSSLDVDGAIYIGGVPSLVEATLDASLVDVKGFNGCIAETAISGKFINSTELLSSYNAAICTRLCDPNPCQNGGNCSQLGASVACACTPEFIGATCDVSSDPCIQLGCEAANSTCARFGETAECVCPLGKGSDDCSGDVVIDTPYFQDNLTSYVGFSSQAVNLARTTNVKVIFTPYALDGIVVYSAEVIDFFSVGLYDGFVEFRFNLGSGTKEVKSRSRVTLFESHTVTVSRISKDVSLIVDDQAEVFDSSSGTATQLNVRGREIFMGGVPDIGQLLPSVGLSSGFTGCIDELTINDVEFSVATATRGQGVKECERDDCEMLNCQNGGTCTDAGSPGTFFCSCPSGYTGPDCALLVGDDCAAGTHGCHNTSQCVYSSSAMDYECVCPLVPVARAGRFCQDVVTFSAAQFGGNSFAEYPFMNFGRKTDISFNVSATAADGLIFYVKGKAKDYLAIGVQAGNVVLSFDLGTGPATITGASILGGGWHYVTISRSSRSATLTVGGISTSGSSPSTATGLNVGGGTYFQLGGIRVSADMTEYANLLGGTYPQGLEGCIADLAVNGVNIDLLNDARDGTNVDRCGA